MSKDKQLIDLIAGARPNFMKVAPLHHALVGETWCSARLIHTGQHYDETMSQTFLDELGLPVPDHALGVGSGTHGEQTAGVMVAYEKVCMDRRPDWIVVVGDVNSTLAAALVGAKLCIPVAHLEAGLRSRDRTMPEEINRIVTDSVADLLWTPSPDADENLLDEGVSADKIDFIGNIMIDSYELLRERIETDGSRESLSLSAGQYGVVTLHRPANVDCAEVLETLLDDLGRVARDIPLVFAMHPRTAKRIDEFGLGQKLHGRQGLLVQEPLPYISFMNLVRYAQVVITDSGGLQEETTYLGIPCLTVRDTTERPITISQGTNRLVEPGDVSTAMGKVIRGDWPRGHRPELWDGQTAQRAVASLAARSRPD